MFRELTWIRENASKLEHSLRQDLINFYKPARWIPCIFHKYFVNYRHRFTKVPVIITADESIVATRSEIKDFTKNYRFKVRHEVPVINSYAGKATIGAIKELAQHPGVCKIYYDREVRALLDIATAAIGANTNFDTGFTGKGVGIAILDTGIAPHKDLTTPENRITVFQDFVSNKKSPYDDNGHGTHVAGCAAGNGSSSQGKYKGPAPEAELIGVKILNRSGSGRTSQILAGIQWCIENREKYNIRIINMSLGAKARNSYKDDPLCKAVEEAWKAGIVVCCAAGNEGPDERTINTPGSDPLIITVGAMNDNNTVNKNDDTLAGFSSRGPTPDGLEKPDIVTPGVNIISLRSPKSQLDKENSENRVNGSYFTMSGTSMATPITAGVVAQIIHSDKDLTPDEVKEIIIKSADPVRADRNEVGAGYLNASKAVTMAKGWKKE